MTRNCVSGPLSVCYSLRGHSVGVQAAEYACGTASPDGNAVSPTPTLIATSLGLALAEAINDAERACSPSSLYDCTLSDDQIHQVARAQVQGFATAFSDPARLCGCSVNGNVTAASMQSIVVAAAVSVHAAGCMTGAQAFRTAVAAAGCASK